MDSDRDETERLLRNGGLIQKQDDSQSSSTVDLPIEAPFQPAYEGGKVYYEVIIITISVFMGYAILVSFQHKLKTKLNIDDKDLSKSAIFGVAVSFLYIGNLVFRLAHNFVFVLWMPRHRVYISMVSMMASMTLLGVGIFWCDLSHISLVFVAYVLGGVSVGSFESNLLSAITPLGHDTKVWAIIGFPTGFALILVSGFGLTALDVKPQYIYIAVAVTLLIGMAIYRFRIPAYVIPNNSTSFSAFLHNLRLAPEWLPKIWVHCIALMIDMYFVSIFSSLMLYIFNGKQVPLLNANSSSTLVPHDWFFAFYNIFTLIGDTGGRKVVYYFRLRNPFIYLILSIIGAVLCLTKIAVLAPLGILCIFLSNGTVYGTGSKYIDMHVAGRFNLIALSVWLFVGDIGSVAGSNTVQYSNHWICSTSYSYVCTSS